MPGERKAQTASSTFLMEQAQSNFSYWGPFSRFFSVFAEKSAALNMYFASYAYWKIHDWF
jgi:hypothetical protein